MQGGPLRALAKQKISHASLPYLKQLGSLHPVTGVRHPTILDANGMDHAITVKPMVVPHRRLFRVGTDARKNPSQIEWQGAFHPQVIAARCRLFLDGSEVALVPHLPLSETLRQPMPRSRVEAIAKLTSK
jgi:hypothetical protein